MRNVIVTGGSRGLGLGIARTLAASGYQVIAVARGESEVLRTAIAAADGPGAIRFWPLDLSELGKLACLVHDIKQAVGPIYGLVNNAGIGTSGLLATLSEAEIEHTLYLNALSPILLTRSVIRKMMVGRSGRIVNVASIVASTGFSGLSVYAATKAAALVGFTRSLAREVGPLGITVNAVAPGFIDTDMTSTLDNAQRDQVVRRSALRRLAEIGDVADAVEFLLSDKASNITGTVMTVDAGSTA
jgi:3-oxoacyl-[acyl-carrier protein] reductase